MKDLFVEDFEAEQFTTAFKKYFAEISTADRNWQMLFRQMNAEKETTKALLRLDGETVVGFVLFCEVEPKCLFFSERLGYIRELWVDPAFRKHGNGSGLLQAAEAEFVKRGVKQVVLSAVPDAQTFYRKNGYAESATIVVQTDPFFVKNL